MVIHMHVSKCIWWGQPIIQAGLAIAGVCQVVQASMHKGKFCVNVSAIGDHCCTHLGLRSLYIYLTCSRHVDILFNLALNRRSM